MKFKRKIGRILVLFCLLFSHFSLAVEPNVASSAAILVESSTGKILFEKNAYEKMYPASTTKVMTAILVLENCDLEEMATVSRNAVFSIPPGYVNCNLRENEQMRVKDLMYALMVKSANDAAVVLAEYVGGSVEGFADKMNEKAKELGCQNTHFVNPNGIHHENHYSTAYDLYLMARYAMKNETFRNYVSTVSYTLPATNQYSAQDRVCLTTNDMIRPNSRYYQENVIGIKTGYTAEAKNCLISAARENNVELISVVLHAGTNAEGLSERYLDTKALFHYGFNDFAFGDIVKANDVVKNIEIANGNKDTRNLNLLAKDTLTTYLNKEIDLNNLTPEITLHENLEAPIVAGSVLGEMTYVVDNIEYSTSLVAETEVIAKINLNIFILPGAIIFLILGVGILLRQQKKTQKNNKKHRK